jgi:hypothetical protein
MSSHDRHRQHIYESVHKKERKRWIRRVRAGGVVCWRWGDPIDPSARWDLGHALALQLMVVIPKQKLAEAESRIEAVVMVGQIANALAIRCVPIDQDGPVTASSAASTCSRLASSPTWSGVTCGSLRCRGSPAARSPFFASAVSRTGWAGSSPPRISPTTYR